MKRLLFVIGFICAAAAVMGQSRTVSNMTAAGDTTDVLNSTQWIRVHDLDGSPTTEAARLSEMIDDGVDTRLGEGELGVALSDSANGAATAGTYVTGNDHLADINSKEDVLTNSAGLAAALSDETGTGVAVFGTSPTFTTQITIGAGVISAAEAGYIDPTSSIQTQLDGKVNLTDTVKSLAVFGFGYGLAGDTVLADATMGVGCGHYHVNEDSIVITKVLTNISSGDTLDYSYVYNDSLGVTTDCDTIVSIDAGDYETETVSFTTTTIPEDNYIWIEIDAVVAGSKPIWFRSDLIGYIKRD